MVLPTLRSAALRGFPCRAGPTQKTPQPCRPAAPLHLKVRHLPCGWPPYLMIRLRSATAYNQSRTAGSCPPALSPHKAAKLTSPYTGERPPGAARPAAWRGWRRLESIQWKTFSAEIHAPPTGPRPKGTRPPSIGK